MGFGSCQLSAGDDWLTDLGQRSGVKNKRAGCDPKDKQHGERVTPLKEPVILHTGGSVVEACIEGA